MSFRHVTILGAGITGLFAAWKLQQKGIQTLLLEKQGQVGGLAKTVTWNGFRFDIGPHSFFTKEQLLLDEMRSLMGSSYQTRARQHQVYFQGQWVPIPLTTRALLKLPSSVFAKGTQEFLKMQSKLLLPKQEKPRFASFQQEEKTLWERLINNDVLNKLWEQKTWSNRPTWTTPDQPRITKDHIYKNILPTLFQAPETAIETFHYPSEGFGSVANELRRQIEEKGGIVVTNAHLRRIFHHREEVFATQYKHPTQGEIWQPTDYIISTIPLSVLLSSLQPLPSHSLVEKSFLFPSKTLGFLLLKTKQTHVDTSAWFDFPEAPFHRASYAFSSNLGGHQKESCLVVEWDFPPEADAKQKTKEAMLEKALPILEASGLLKESDIFEVSVHFEKAGVPVQNPKQASVLRELKTFITQLRRLRSLGWHGKLEACRLSQAIHMGLEAARTLIDESSPKRVRDIVETA